MNSTDLLFTRADIGFAFCYLFAWVRGTPLTAAERDEAWAYRWEWLERERKMEGGG
jgi:hypothetical protein